MEARLKAQWAELADLLGQTGLDILAEKPLTLTAKGFAEPKVLAIMLLSRTFSNLKGVLTLVETNLVVEARVLARCCVENQFWIAGLVSDGDRFVNRMREADARSRQSIGELVLSKRPKIQLGFEAIREQLRSLKKRWPRAQPLFPKEVADIGPLQDAYLFYSQLSADAGHPTMTSLNRYVGYTDDGERIIQVAPAPQEEEVVLTLDWACNAMLGACVGVNQILGGTQAGQILNAIGDRYLELAANSKTVKSAPKIS